MMTLTNNNATSNTIVLGTTKLNDDITVTTTAPKKPEYVTFNYGDMLSIACKYVTKQRMIEILMTFINNCLNNMNIEDRVEITEQYSDDPDDINQYRVTHIRIPHISDKIKDYVCDGVVLDSNNNIEYIINCIDCYDADCYSISITCKNDHDYSDYTSLYIDIQDWDCNMW